MEFYKTKPNENTLIQQVFSIQKYIYIYIYHLMSTVKFGINYKNKNLLLIISHH